jgi:hypothetical protein
MWCSSVLLAAGVGFVLGVGFSQSECETTVWWNPWAAWKALRGMEQNPFVLLLAPDAADASALASGTILSTAIGALGIGASRASRKGGTSWEGRFRQLLNRKAGPSKFSHRDKVRFVQDLWDTLQDEAGKEEDPEEEFSTTATTEKERKKKNRTGSLAGQTPAGDHRGMIPLPTSSTRNPNPDLLCTPTRRGPRMNPGCPLVIYATPPPDVRYPSHPRNNLYALGQYPDPPCHPPLGPPLRNPEQFQSLSLFPPPSQPYPFASCDQPLFRSMIAADNAFRSSQQYRKADSPPRPRALVY